MTLIEELEQAAKDLDVIADAFASPSYGRREKTAAEMHARADRLRKRVERIKEVERDLLLQTQSGSEPAALAIIGIEKIARELP